MDVSIGSVHRYGHGDVLNDDVAHAAGESAARAHAVHAAERPLVPADVEAEASVRRARLPEPRVGEVPVDTH